MQISLKATLHSRDNTRLMAKQQKGLRLWLRPCLVKVPKEWELSPNTDAAYAADTAMCHAGWLAIDFSKMGKSNEVVLGSAWPGMHQHACNKRWASVTFVCTDPFQSDLCVSVSLMLQHCNMRWRDIMLTGSF